MVLTCLGLIFILSICHAHDHGKGFSKETLEDKEHLKQHLEAEGVKVNFTEMTPEQQRFFFFKFHDKDNSSSIDGLELLKSLLHDEFEMHLGFADKHEKLTEEFYNETTGHVDDMLKKADTDDNGYISYMEFNIYATQMQREEDSQKA